MRPTGKQLYDWAKKKHHPTVKEAAKRFGCSMGLIRQVIEDTDIASETGDLLSYLGLGVAYGNQTGMFELPEEAQIVEAYTTKAP